MRFYLAAPLAALSGVFMLSAFPNYSFWPGALIGVAGLAYALKSQTKVRNGLFLGLIFGATFWLPLINWLSLYLGPIPWLALASVMILWFGLFGVMITFIARATNSLNMHLQAFAFALGFGGLWVAREIVQSNFPYDGFAWGRLAHTQSEGPLLEVVAWLGFAGFGGLLAFLAVLPVAYTGTRGNVKGGSIALVSVLIMGFALSLVAVPQLKSTGTAEIAGVQGNSKSGVFDDRESGDVIADHLRVTREWLSTDPDVDIVVWPENSAEFNLPWRPENLERVRELVEESEASFAVGSILGEEIDGERRYTNSSLVLEPDSKAIARYDKRYPVPFAEYMPHRSFYRALVPHLVDLVQLEYEHGTTSTVLPVAHTEAGIAICFDIIFDSHARMMNSEGAEVILAQTNNADFGQTAQSAQQLAISRVRAVEMGRDLVNISTVATSQIVGFDGSVRAAIAPWEPGVMQASVELRSGSTPAMKFGALYAGIWSALGLAGMILAVVLNRRSLNVESTQK